jgi:hypothetical protein
MHVAGLYLDSSGRRLNNSHRASSGTKCIQIASTAALLSINRLITSTTRAERGFLKRELVREFFLFLIAFDTANFRY